MAISEESCITGELLKRRAHGMHRENPCRPGRENQPLASTYSAMLKPVRLFAFRITRTGYASPRGIRSGQSSFYGIIRMKENRILRHSGHGCNGFAPRKFPVPYPNHVPRSALKNSPGTYTMKKCTMPCMSWQRTKAMTLLS